MPITRSYEKSNLPTLYIDHKQTILKYKKLIFSNLSILCYLYHFRFYRFVFAQKINPQIFRKIILLTDKFLLNSNSIFLSVYFHVRNDSGSFIIISIYNTVW